MGWTERQQAMLREMGLRLWTPPAAAQPPTDASPAPDLLAPADTSRNALTADRAAPPLPASSRSSPSAPSTPSPTPTIPTVPTSATSPVAALDWPALRDAVAACRACSLCDARRQTVFGVGHARAHCMVVGEAPGEQEDAQGEPFVGAAGQLLDRMLAALGLGRAEATPARQVFIANALKCRPPRNRNPSAAELAACQPFLERQVALVQPRVILAMGRFAVQQLLGTDAPIGRLRGQVHQWCGVPLVVTYHPAYLLRQPADKARAWDDLCLAAELLARPPPG